MEIVLISDGPLPIDSPMRKLPFFFSARLIDMSRVSAETVGNAGIAIVELLKSTDAGLTALKSSWQSIAEIPVICLVDKNNRREVIQAGALGKSEQLQRDTPFALLIRRIRTLTVPDVASRLPAGTEVKTAEALRSGAAFLDSLCFASVENGKIPVKQMAESGEEILAAVALDGLASWMDAVNIHHSPTYRHSLVVAGLAGAFAIHLGWEQKDLKEVVGGGLLHDIGKTRIPLSILDKAGKLTDAERAQIDRHPEFGREILKPRVEVPIDVKKMAIQHHEYLDGSGYPDGLSGARITPKVRLITICDIYAALTETRAYKEAFSPRNALVAMRDMGDKLDQAMVQKFARMILENGLGDVCRGTAA